MGQTVTLYDVIQSELILSGKREIVNDGELVYFNDAYAFMKKVMNFDEDVQKIVNEKLFFGQSLSDPELDKHFKKTFLNRFNNRQINEQTIEGFAMKVGYVFMTNEPYINRIYTDLDKFLLNEQETTGQNGGSSTNDNRTAYAQLPQDNVQLDVNDTVMDSADDNTISRNKTTNEATNSSSSKQYRLDELFKTNGLLEEIFNKFDRYCFIQTW